MGPQFAAARDRGAAGSLGTSLTADIMTYWETCPYWSVIRPEKLRTRIATLASFEKSNMLLCTYDQLKALKVSLAVYAIALQGPLKYLEYLILFRNIVRLENLVHEAIVGLQSTQVQTK